MSEPARRMSKVQGWKGSADYGRPALSLWWWVNTDSWVPARVQLAWLWFKRSILGRAL